ncbi:zinc finger CCCH domain-containing protein 18 [Drosophila rhopaloa]|uniref:Zinc finger CCCH domain-containing protein 18 n=1 Tax=Drosophila rhopaloa TaxID=1041015 RepID=A0A6P4F347_DRORH|nr:zinc finger CCCH domain-containing protein 18 [Drosophila rhopaloa]XP_016983424.1 zinc finger CCCH domain-containing protein 18 [Drosophila rhopaloa]
MVLDMESDDSRASSPSNSSESRSSSPTNDKEEEIAPDPVEDQADESAGGGGGATLERSVRAASTSSSSSNSSSSSSRSELSKKQKKSSSSSSGSGSGSSSSSGSSSEDEVDQEPELEQEPLSEQQRQRHAVPEPEPESLAAATAEEVQQPGSPSAKSQPSSFLSSVRSRSNSPQLYNQAAVDLNISHEDLSDVSDIEADEKRAPSKNSLHPADEDEDGAISNDSLPAMGEEDAVQQNGKAASGDEEKASAKETKPDEASNGRAPASALEEDLVKTHDDDALDFEAEEGECPEPVKEPPSESKANETNQAKGPTKGPEDNDDDDDGEVDGDEDDTDDKDKRKDTAGNGSLEEGEDDKEKEAAALATLKRKKEEEELEEGEVSDEDEKRPEETEPKPVCRFYTRGQCTWGMSCRFLHPGVTDKGNYTMFESLVRSVPMQGGSAAAGAASAGSSAAAARAGSAAYGAHSSSTADFHDYRNERPPLHHRPALLHAPSIYGAHVHDSRTLLPEAPVVVENAWERGLRTAKEMMRKANKRKEQDMDFEDKKMNLTLSPDEMEKDSYYLKDRGGSSARSPPPQSGSVREQPLNPLMPLSMHPHAVAHSNPRALLPLQYSVYGPPPDRYARGQYMPPQYEDVDAYGRMARYRELPPHRMPHYEDDRRLRPAREVIVQRVEAAGRGDEWSDPWMRSKSMGRGGSYDREDRRRRDRRSYSSNSSYSTSNSSQSDSSSDSSRSSSPSDHKRRYGGSSHKLAGASASARRHGGRAARSPSQIPRRPRHSSKGSLSPSYKRPALDKRGAGHSPASKRKKLSSPAPKKFDKLRRRRSSSTSDSDSSDTSYSESESGSSSSDSSSGSRDTPQKRVRATDKALNERKLIKKPAEQATKKRSPISIEIKKTSNMVGVSALASPNNSADSDKEKEHGNGKDKEKEHSKDKDKEGKDKDKDKDGGKDKDGKKSRREELLKQLRAVEDAIAKKRSKLN